MRLNQQILLFLILSVIVMQAQEKITVIGLGRLGLCTALCFERAGFEILGVDILSSYVENLNNKNFRSHEPSVEEYLYQSKHFTATTSLDQGLEFSDIYFIVVDTPSGAHEAYDHTRLSRLLSNINQRKVKNKHIVICSTIFPGYIGGVAQLLLKDCENTTINYNPEFIAQGSIISNFENPDMILIGEGSAQAGNRIEQIYHRVCKNKPVIMRMSPSSAEITKLAINCYITHKIAYANMIADIADETNGANKYDILKAVGTDSRIGSKYLKPGYGFGGPCFPRDNRALASYAQQVGIEPLLPRATDMMNKLHALYMAESMSSKEKSEYVFWDINYKDNCPVTIIEESQKLAVAQILAKKGHRVIIKDRPQAINLVQEKYGALFEYEII